MTQNPVIRHIVKPLHRICDSTIQRFNDLTRRSHSSFRASAAFTLIELIVVTTVIIILTGLVLSTVGYVQKKGARARAETEIAAMSAACESYKADNGIYPTDASTTEQLNSTTSFNPTNYQSASLICIKNSVATQLVTANHPAKATWPLSRTCCYQPLHLLIL